MTRKLPPFDRDLSECMMLRELAIRTGSPPVVSLNFTTNDLDERWEVAYKVKRKWTLMVGESLWNCCTSALSHIGVPDDEVIDLLENASSELDKQLERVRKASSRSRNSAV